MKIIISGENAGRLQKKATFFVLFVERLQAVIPFPPSFCNCWLHKRHSGIRGELKEDNTFKCRACVNQQIDIAQDCPNIKLNSQSLEVVKKRCLGDPVGARGGADGSVITKGKSGWSIFRDLVLLLACRGLHLGVKKQIISHIYTQCCASKIWSEQIEIMPGWSDGCAVVVLKIDFLLWKLGLD